MAFPLLRKKSSLSRPGSDSSLSNANLLNPNEQMAAQGVRFLATLESGSKNLVFDRPGHNPHLQDVVKSLEERHPFQIRYVFPECCNFYSHHKFSLGADPQTWGSGVTYGDAEADDIFHNPVYRNGKLVDDTGLSFSGRGLANLGCLSIVILGLLALL